ncbi:hypothetical protein [Actinoplanes sp. NPDC051494]|uniref:hypothetical protein n=1 Tax=Actinoplanes sp. NPDC051494 TaxID=3363907 RepID=UPI0037AEF134
MGEFVHLTALPVADPAIVADAITRFAAGHGVGSRIVTAGTATTKDIAVVVPPRDGWLVVDWPRYAGYQGTASSWLSREFGVVASSINIYDSDMWWHVAYESGRVADRFASDPAYMVVEGVPESRWRGDAAVLGDLFARPPDTLASYFVNPDTFTFRLFRRFLAPYAGKVFPDDECTIDDTWVIIDFWRRLGITYPEAAPEEWSAYPAVQFLGEFPPSASNND